MQDFRVKVTDSAIFGQILHGRVISEFSHALTLGVQLSHHGGAFANLATLLSLYFCLHFLNQDLPVFTKTRLKSV